MSSVVVQSLIQAIIILLIVNGQPPADVHFDFYFGLTNVGDNIITYTYAYGSFYHTIMCLLWSCNVLLTLQSMHKSKTIGDGLRTRDHL